MAIQERALLVKLSICLFNTKGTDVAVTRDTLSRYHVSDGNAGRFVKNLFPQNPLSKLEKHTGQWRNWNYKNTLPWLDEGMRIKPAVDWIDYQRESNVWKSKSETFRDQFLADYDKHIDRASKILGERGLFHPEDYPTQDAAFHRFSFTLDVFPIPSRQDFRVKFAEDDMKDLQDSLDEKIERASALAEQDLWLQLSKPVRAMADKLKDPTAIFRDTLIGNVLDIVDRIPKLNILDNAELTQLRDEVREKLVGVNPDSLRTDVVQRKAVQIEAERLAGVLSSYLK